jgi:glycolate oxidase iron-sulfur subunit
MGMASGKAEPAARELLHLDYAATLDCVHCGLCLPVCPTYQETGREPSSPRGRIYLMRGFADERIDLDRTLIDEMYFCLACRACESACPAGVRYGHLVETMRAEIDARSARPRRTRFLQRLLLRRVVAGPRTLAFGFSLLRFYQRSGLQSLVRRTHLLRPAGPLARAERMLPPIPSPHRPPLLVPALGRRRGRVAFFRGCLVPEVFGPVNAATVDVLSRNGFEVVIPSAQRCCGALHLHAGDPHGAARLRRRNRSVLQLDSVDAVIVNSAGCGATLKDGDDPLGRKVQDIAEFLESVELRGPLAPLPLKVAYDDPCHLLHGQRIASAPRALLRRIPELDLIDLPGCRDCCGAAGIYNLIHPETAGLLLDRKVKAVRAVEPDVVATGNPGCLLQIGMGVREAGLRVEVLHPVELLQRAYAGAPKAGSVPAPTG